MPLDSAMNQKIEASTVSALRPARVPAASAGRAQAIAPIRASDRLHLTGEAAGLQTLQRELTAAPAIDNTRVAAIREALASGNYQVNPEQIATRMLELDQQLGA